MNKKRQYIAVIFCSIIVSIILILVANFYMPVEKIDLEVLQVRKKIIEAQIIKSKALPYPVPIEDIENLVLYSARQIVDVIYLSKNERNSLKLNFPSGDGKAISIRSLKKTKPLSCLSWLYKLSTGIIPVTVLSISINKASCSAIIFMHGKTIHSGDK